MPSRNLLLLPHYPKNRPEAAPRVSNGSAWRLAAGSGDYCGAESPSLGFVGLGSARGGIGSGARATGMPFRLVVRGMFPETSSRTAGPVGERPALPLTRRSHMRHELGYHQGIQPSNGRFYSPQPPPPGPATPGGSLAARGRPQCRSGPRAPAHPRGGGGGAQEQV